MEKVCTSSQNTINFLNNENSRIRKTSNNKIFSLEEEINRLKNKNSNLNIEIINLKNNLLELVGNALLCGYTLNKHGI